MESNDRYAALRLSSQLCFPLYAASKELVRQYKPFLDPLDLTYTQYIAMMVLWEKQAISVKDLGEALWLDSGTLTPVLKKLEQKGYLTRQRSEEDERSVVLSLTESGAALREAALTVPQRLGSCVRLRPEEVQELYRLLYKVLDGMR